MFGKVGVFSSVSVLTATGDTIVAVGQRGACLVKIWKILKTGELKREKTFKLFGKAPDASNLYMSTRSLQRLASRTTAST